MADQAEHLRAVMHSTMLEGRISYKGNDRVVAVASGKGGVGKSNFCVNFAIALQQAGHRPIVVDADVGFANVEVLLDVRPRYSLLDVLSGVDIWDVVEQSPAGIPFLSAGNGLLDIHSLSASEMEQILYSMQQLHHQYDIIVLDTGAGLGSNVGRLLSAADDLILVTTPEPTAITDAYALLKLLCNRSALPSTQIVVNRAQKLVDGRHAAEKLKMVSERFLNIRIGILGYILEDNSVGEAVMHQRALLHTSPNSQAARCIVQLAQNFLHIESTAPRLGIAGFLQRIFHKTHPGGGRDSGHTA